MEGTNKKTAFIGLGNRDRGDDAVGLRFVDDLRQLNPNFFFSEEDGLEKAVLEVIKRKDVHNVVFVDVCDMGSEPGKINLLQAEDVKESVTTHKVPIAVLMALLKKEGKNPLLLGIQPESLEFEGDISNTMKDSLKNIEDAVKKALKV